jgi:DNA-binding winged helix-turn-helix (wHTH) protein
VLKTPQKISAPACIINAARHEVTINGTVVSFPPKEYRILSELGKAKGHVVSRAQLLERVWGYESAAAVDIDTRTVDQHIARLRMKLRRLNADNIIQTIPLAGYRSDSIAFAVDKATEILGKVNHIRRVYGKKPGSWLTLFVADLLPEMKRGRNLRLS